MIFLFGLPYYRREVPTRDNTMLKTFGCIIHAVSVKIRGNSSEPQLIDNAVGKYTKEFVHDVKKFLKVVKLFLPLPIFYALLAQQDSTWTFQATLMDTNIFGIEIQADQFKALGPILLLVLIPLWQKVINPLLRKCNIYLGSLECVFLGCLSAALSFVYAGFLHHQIFNSNERISILWQFPQFLFIMIAEMLISVPGLKFAYTHAPTSMKSVLTAIFFINNAIGNLIVVIITQLNLFPQKTFEFYFYALLMVMAAVLIRFLSHGHDDMPSSDEETIETYIFVDEVQSTNMEENCTFHDEIC
jgi:dipeptide/tripeptide permease